jgi:uncharacterized protein (TIGR00255 family)
VARGRVEVTIGLQLRQQSGVEVELNEAVVQALSDALERARTIGLVAGPLTPGDLMRVPQALTIKEKPEAAMGEAFGVVVDAVSDALVEAAAHLDEMRTREGAHLRAELDGRRAGLRTLIDEVARTSDEGSGQLRDRLAARVTEMAGDLSPDPAAVAQEIVRFVARSDITEELVRFRGHLDHWQAIVESAEPCGRKLDFLLQEMNREINTIGSKSEGRTMAELIVTAKAELEKMREQVQNVE